MTKLLSRLGILLAVISTSVPGLAFGADQGDLAVDILSLIHI